MIAAKAGISIETLCRTALASAAKDGSSAAVIAVKTGQWHARSRIAMVARGRAVSRGISTTAGVTTTLEFQDDLDDLLPPGGDICIEAD